MRLLRTAAPTPTKFEIILNSALTFRKILLYEVSITNLSATSLNPHSLRTTHFKAIPLRSILKAVVKRINTRQPQTLKVLQRLCQKLDSWVSGSKLQFATS